MVLQIFLIFVFYEHFLPLKKAQNFINGKKYPNIYTLVDIIETKLDAGFDPNLENKLYI